MLLPDDCMPGHVTRTPCMSYHMTKCAFPIMGNISPYLVDEGMGVLHSLDKRPTVDEG